MCSIGSVPGRLRARGVNRPGGAGFVSSSIRETNKRRYVGCSAIRCTAEYEGGEKFFDQIKHGHTLALEAVDKADAPIRLIVPLVGYADAYDGAPQEPKVFEMTTKEMQSILEDRKGRCGTER
jgi:Invasion associated locus B (IalB) protein